MFAWLETTPVADWVALSLWAYPSLLSFHIVGLAVVVGLFVIRDLRLVGVISGLDPAIFLKLSPLAWAGFVVNLTSGLLLFSSQATIFISNVPFLIKISCIVLGMTLAQIIQGKIREQLVNGEEDQATLPEDGGALRVLAMASLVIWITAISAGRLIAYF